MTTRAAVPTVPPLPSMSEAEAAKFLGLCTRTLRNLRWSGRGPRFVQVIPRGKVTYTVTDLDDWREKHKRHSTSDRSLTEGSAASAAR